MKVLPLAAHMFVFYFGIMADLTPPVCLAAFTGAGIAGADPTKTGFTATKIALCSYIMPYMFVFNPMILLNHVVWHELIILAVSAMLGVIILAGALEGWFYRTLRIFERAIMAICALAAIHHSMIMSLVGTAAIIMIIIYLRQTKERAVAA